MPRKLEIGPEAWRVMVQGFRASKPASMVAAIVERETGETIALRTVERRYAAWRAEEQRRKAAREQMEDFVSAMKANDATAAEMVQALAMDALMMHPDRFQGSDPIKVQGTGLYAREVALKERKVALEERKVAVIEQKLRIAEEKERRVQELAKKDTSAEQMTAEDRLAKIRQIYGLTA